MNFIHQKLFFCSQQVYLILLSLAPTTVSTGRLVTVINNDVKSSRKDIYMML